MKDGILSLCVKEQDEWPNSLGPEKKYHFIEKVDVCLGCEIERLSEQLKEANDLLMSYYNKLEQTYIDIHINKKVKQYFEKGGA